MRLPLLYGFMFVPAIGVGATTHIADLEVARSLMRPGYNLAGVQAEIIERSGNGRDGWNVGRLPKLLIRDINGDGRKDVFMAVEENPKIEDSQGLPCEKPDSERGCFASWGERVIEVHYQRLDGSYRLGTRSGLMMDKEEGGMDPDPFKGFRVTPKGSIQIHFSGGAGWKWEHIYTVQFRKDDIYLIGAYDYLCSGARDDVECYEADVNLLTGQWWRTTWIGERNQRKKREGRLEKRHLYRLEEAFPDMDPCAPPPRPDYDPTMHVLGGPQTGFSCDESTR